MKNTAKMVYCREVKSGQKVAVPVADLAFRISVYGIVFKDEHVLLVPQWDGYDYPGGGIDLGETTVTAIQREVLEETGISVTPITDPVLMLLEDFVVHPGNQKPYHWFTAYYACLSPTGELSDAHFDTGEAAYSQKAQWVPLAAIDNLKFYNSVHDNPSLIRKAQQTNRPDLSLSTKHYS